MGFIRTFSYVYIMYFDHIHHHHPLLSSSLSCGFPSSSQLIPLLLVWILLGVCVLFFGEPMTLFRFAYSSMGNVPGDTLLKKMSLSSPTTIN